MNTRAAVVVGALMWVAAGTADAQADPVAQTVGHGKINWSDKTITATGSGAPDLKAANVAVARLGAERAAKMDALRNILEAVRGLRVQSGESAGDRMDASPELKASVEGVVKNFKVIDTKYYSDGGVDVIVQVPLDGVITGALVKAGVKAAPPNGADAASGVVINAKGLGLVPALAPRIVDDKGQEIFSAALVAEEAVKRHGVAGYTKNLDGALKDARVADKPLVVRAQKLTAAGASDLVISAEDGAKIAKLTGALANAKVIIVTD